MRWQVLVLAAVTACGSPRPRPTPPVEHAPPPRPPLALDDLVHAVPADSEIVTVMDFTQLRKSSLLRALWFQLVPELAKSKMGTILDLFCIEATDDLELGVFGGMHSPQTWVGFMRGEREDQLDDCKRGANYQRAIRNLHVEEHHERGLDTVGIVTVSMQVAWAEPALAMWASFSDGAPPLTSDTAHERIAKLRAPSPPLGPLSRPELADLYEHVDRKAGLFVIGTDATLTALGGERFSFSLRATDKLELTGRVIMTSEEIAAQTIGRVRPSLDALVSTGYIVSFTLDQRGKEIHGGVTLTRAGLERVFPRLRQPSLLVPP